ncbi:DUF6318 family protein [Kytococcus schroeteri]
MKTAVLAVCGALLVGACSSDAEGGGSSSTTPDAVETSAPMSSPSDATAPGSPEPSGGGSSDASPSGGSGAPTSPAPNTSDGETPAPPVMPAAAKENTAEGAEAFGIWYLKTLNHLYQHPKAGVLEEFSETSCGTCAQLESTVRESAAEGHRATSSPMKIRPTARVTPLGGKKWMVGVRFDQLKTDYVDESGAVVESVPRSRNSGFSMRLVFQDGWHIVDMPLQRHAEGA